MQRKLLMSWLEGCIYFLRYPDPLSERWCSLLTHMYFFFHFRLERNPDLSVLGFKLFYGVDVGNELPVDAEEFFAVENGFELSQVFVDDKLMACVVFHKYDAVLSEEEGDFVEGERHELRAFFDNDAVLGGCAGLIDQFQHVTLHEMLL